MPSKSAEVPPRTFDSTLAAGLSDEARKAVKLAFDAMSTWRTQIVNNEKNIEAVIDKVAAGARALGWPKEIVDAIHAQMKTMNETQLQLMDQVMDVWEEQIKSPNPASAMLSRLRSLPAFSPVASWPGASASQMNPFGLYMQVAQQWQKAWTDAMAPWIKH
jgi:hypothetical protein